MNTIMVGDKFPDLVGLDKDEIFAFLEGNSDAESEGELVSIPLTDVETKELEKEVVAQEKVIFAEEVKKKAAMDLFKQNTAAPKSVKKEALTTLRRGTKDIETTLFVFNDESTGVRTFVTEDGVVAKQERMKVKGGQSLFVQKKLADVG